MLLVIGLLFSELYTCNRFILDGYYMLYFLHILIIFWKLQIVIFTIFNEYITRTSQREKIMQIR